MTICFAGYGVALSPLAFFSSAEGLLEPGRRRGREVAAGELQSSATRKSRVRSADLVGLLVEGEVATIEQEYLCAGHITL